MAKNGYNCAHSWWGQMEHMSTWTGVCPRIGINSYLSNIHFGRRPTPAGFGNGRVAKSAHDLGFTRIAHMVALVCQAEKELLARTKI